MNRSSKPRRIVHFSSVHRWNDTRVFRRMCRSLAQAGHEVHWVVADDEIPKYQMVDGVHVHAVRRKTGKFRRMWQTTRAICRKAFSLEGQIYHFHDPELIPFAAAYASRRRPVIYDAHEDLPKDLVDKDWIPRWLGRTVSLPIDCVERLGSLRFAAIIGAEEAIERRFQSIVKRTVSIHNYPALSDYPEPAFQPNLSQPTIVHFGGLSPLRAIEPLVKALGRLPADSPVKLIAAGRCESEELLQRLQQLPGYRRVDYRGWISHQEMSDLLAEASIAMNLFSDAPNNQRIRSNRFFESLAAGVPVITSNLPDWKAMIDGVRCGLAVNANDPEAIADAIQYLLTDREAASQMARRGRQAIVDQFNWESEFDKLQSLYAEIVNDRGPGRDR